MSPPKRRARWWKREGGLPAIHQWLLVDRIRTGLRRAIIVGRCGLIHGIVARAAAAMTPPPPMQRKAVGRAVVAVRAIAAALALRTIRTLAVLRSTLVLRLTAGDE